MNSLHKFIFITLLSLFAFACEGGDNPSEEERQEAQVKLLIDNALDLGVAPTILQLENLSTQLLTEIEAIENITGPIDLSSLRSSWLEMSKGLRRMEALDTDFEIRMLGFYYKAGGFDAEGFEDKLRNNEAFDPRRGAMNAIEYLIFDEGNIDAALLLEEQVERRIILKTLGVYIKEGINSLKSIWESKVIDIQDKTSVDARFQLSRISTHMFIFISDSRRGRLMFPMGITFGSGVDAERLEAFRSESSLALLKEGFSSWKEVFYGSYENSPDEYGYDDYLLFLKEEELLEKLNTAIEKVEQKMAELSLLKEDIINQPWKMENLIDEMQTLEILLRVDMASTMQLVLFQEQHEDD